MHYIQNKSTILIMIIPFTLLLGAFGYLYYKSKDEVTLLEDNQLDEHNEKKIEDDLYKDLEDLFIWFKLSESMFIIIY